MSNKLIVVYAGSKGSGKSTAGKFTFIEFLNAKIGKKRFVLEKSGKETLVIDTFNNNTILNIEYPCKESKILADTYSVKIYSFLDPLRRFCIDILGLDPIQCYGSEDDQNSPTHISWDDLPVEIREKHSRSRRGNGGYKPASGFMTAQEVMNVFGLDLCMRIDTNCWSRGLYSMIEQEGYELAVIVDASLPNQITLGTERKAKVVKLQRNVDEEKHTLNEFPLGEFTLVIDNQDKTINETHKIIKPSLTTWFEQSRII